MEQITLQAQVREEKGKNKIHLLRRDGFIPAVVYGADIDSMNIKLVRSEFLQFIRQHHIETVVFNLVVKEKDKKVKEYTCMIKEIQYDPLSDEVIHVDFNNISLTKLLKVKVPILPQGEPIGVKQEGGVLDRLLWEIEIECLPSNIPKQIEVDVSNLKLNESIQIKDISSLGEGIKILTPRDTVVFIVTPILKEELVAEGVNEERMEPEVIKEKKETEERESKEEQPDE
ncbi:MAG: 50S ribosomal protein L25 [Candidatus Omnitrophica bacterium]|nr:50S ribosomal protein L25 [Candidatus Omnitrophota bacterium]